MTGTVTLTVFSDGDLLLSEWRATAWTDGITQTVPPIVPYPSMCRVTLELTAHPELPHWLTGNVGLELDDWALGRKPVNLYARPSEYFSAVLHWPLPAEWRQWWREFPRRVLSLGLRADFGPVDGTEVVRLETRDAAA